jgi:hypothetical protein
MSQRRGLRVAASKPQPKASIVIDIILFGFFVGSVYGGFWLGAKFGTLAKTWEAVKAKF